MHMGAGRSRLVAGMAALACLMAGHAFSARAQTAPTVDATAGQVEGVAEHGVLAFKGMPYAAPPVGDLRWRAPGPVPAWQGIRKAQSFGNACMQDPELSIANGGDPGPASEDCLYLNVWTPKLDPAARLPVMVWIHGGAYVFGSGSLTLYNGAPLARRGAVVVTINYRLGQLGFFMHPALQTEDGGLANFGLLDQIAALGWVQQNIARFGGDAGNVTIFGQSAGGKSVLALVASPMARGLFHKGIAQSSYAVPDQASAKALEVGNKLADALGLGGANATAAQLRLVPARKFAEIKGQGLSNAPVPISGDKVLPQSIEATFAAGKEAPVPLILGNTSDDASVVSAFGIDSAQVLERLGAAGLLIRALYPGVRDKAQLARQATRDFVFTLPVRGIADRHSKRAPTWRYSFEYTAVAERPEHRLGVPHGGDVPYALETGDLFEGTRDIFTEQDRRYARSVADYWFAFARTGTPSAQGGLPWPAHRSGQDRTLVFADTIAVRRNFMRARLTILLGASRLAGRILDRK